jgi:hypothetical protein
LRLDRIVVEKTIGADPEVYAFIVRLLRRTFPGK